MSKRDRSSTLSGSTVGSIAWFGAQLSANEGAIDWLLACPQKGFFAPIESESTDVL